MGLEDRPYVGTWSANRHKVIKHTPDCLVYINGDTALPGCARCNGRIDIQRYITSVSVDAGVDPGAASGISISLSVPLHHADPVARDAKYLLTPALEVCIYMRGYFPVSGQFQNVTPDETDGVDIRNVVIYPYYHVFHGVTTSVDHAIEGGFQTISVNCASILNFWQYQNMSTSGSLFGARPNNSGVKTTLVGNNFNGKTPYAIIYQLFHDVAGAASSVGYALSSATSMKARTDVLGENLFSVALKYWENRFRSKMMNLRMHGASGQVFSTAQAAFLSRLSEAEITNLVRKSFASKSFGDPVNRTDITAAAQSLGIIRKVRDPVSQIETVRGPDVSLIDRGVPDEGSGYEISLGSMQAYVQDLTQFGSVNLWESTYETKLAVAQKVCEVTGFELYQDVDGDIVFKPPLYNLDTSGSRVYRIEDEDIYSFTSNEKEPEATYVTIKGSQFKNLAGTGLDNEWGVRGQFIDYRAVAQFGWRETTLETAYLNNAKAMFWVAVNRLDILNAPVKSGSLTIPLRPEIRPGYPVYVVFLDAFFYVTGFSHSFSFGGRCTTTLQLVARRGKFFAPGKVGSSGVEGIDLANVTLPAKPLEVIDNRGIPKWAGFPNVVMALDPDLVNPLHFMVGTDFEDISDPRVLRNLIEAAKQYGVIVPDPNGDEANGPFIMYVDGNQEQIVDPTGQTVRDALQESNSATVQQHNVPAGKVPQEIGTFDSLSAASKKYKDFTDRTSELLGSSGQKQEFERQLASIEAEILNLESLNRSLRGRDAETSQQVKDNNSRLSELKETRSKVSTSLKEARSRSDQEQRLQSDLQSQPDVVMLKQLVKALQNAYIEGNPDYPNGQSTAAYLDILADKKANFTNGHLPGSYRYYSCSHPDPSQQGMSQLTSARGRGPTGGGDINRLDSPSTTEGFVTPTKPGPNGVLPEAQLGDVQVVNGIHILLSSGDGVVPTSSIQTLSFAKHNADIEQGKTNYYQRQYWSGLDNKYRSWLHATLQRNANSVVQFGLSIKEALLPAWNLVRPEDNGLYSETFDFPDTLVHAGVLYDTSSVTINDFRNSVYGPFVTPRPAVDLLVKMLEASLSQSLTEMLVEKWSVVTSYDPEVEVELSDRIDAERTFANILSSATRRQSVFKVGSYVKRERSVTTTFYSPVFPVSDEHGYELYGTYRYGRGLGIQYDNSLQALYEADPLRFASPQDVESFLDVLTGKEPEQSTYIAVDAAGNETVVPVASRYDKLRAEEQRILGLIQSNPEVPGSVVTLLDQSTQSGVGLSNWTASSDEFTQKLLVSNVGYLLSDIKPDSQQEMCSCRAAEAGVALEAFGGDFLEVVPADADQITRYVGEQTFVKAQQWSHNQDMLRGKTRDLSLEEDFRQGLNYRNTPGVPLPEDYE